MYKVNVEPCNDQQTTKIKIKINHAYTSLKIILENKAHNKTSFKKKLIWSWSLMWAKSVNAENV